MSSYSLFCRYSTNAPNNSRMESSVSASRSESSPRLCHEGLFDLSKSFGSVSEMRSSSSASF